MTELDRLYALRRRVDAEIRAEIRRIEQVALREQRRLDALRRRDSYCGTDTGYKYHRRADEESCLPCRAAHATAERERAARRREAA